jgi:osmotically-inducible protein OsmY
MKSEKDSLLREAVQKQLDWEPAVRSTDIGVAAGEGVITLSGFAESFAEKVAVEKSAKRVYGVKAVANDLVVKADAELTDPEIGEASCMLSNTTSWSRTRGSRQP